MSNFVLELRQTVSAYLLIFIQIVFCYFSFGNTITVLRAGFVVYADPTTRAYVVIDLWRTEKSFCLIESMRLNATA